MERSIRHAVRLDRDPDRVKGGKAAHSAAQRIQQKDRRQDH
jgi:hypothetical protein